MGDSQRMMIGAARTEIGPTPAGICMFGWAMLHNVVQGVATPLHVRAFVLDDGEDLVGLVVGDVGMMSMGVKHAVCERLRLEHPEIALDETNLLLSATHTHSGPGGFTHYHLYNITIPGFVPAVFDAVVTAFTNAIVDAHARRRPGRMRWGQSVIGLDVPVAFNRAIPSYNLNRDVEKLSVETRARGIDRTIRLLEFETEDGRPIGSINWFGVHCTSMHSDNHDLHFDNKGYAAVMLERQAAEAGHPDYVAAFAQGAAGDVTPNFQKHPGRPWVRGTDPDDDVSARQSGGFQADGAQAARDRLSPTFTGPIETAHQWFDFSDVGVDRRHAGAAGCRTGPAELGLAMLFGTDEGPGIPRNLLFAQNVARGVRTRVRRRSTRMRRGEVQGEKLTIIESGKQRIVGLRRFSGVPLPPRVHPAFHQLRALSVREPERAKPWTPQVLPLQLIRLGPVVIAAAPGEFTTQAGRRVRASVQRALSHLGLESVVLSGYSNAYAGYVTTAEEYARQDYEGASTHFGRWTLAAYQTLFDRVAETLGDRHARAGPANGPRPPRFDSRDLAPRTYAGPMRMATR
jgi:neutral ceramidase